MIRFGMLIKLCAFAAMLPTVAAAKDLHGQVGAHDARRAPLPVVSRKSHFILRQDLFDRQNPTNLRSDWPGPPAQPGQF
jgi:hypothetical protein